MSNYTILIVDDEKNILKTLRRLFVKEGYVIFSALSGEEGLTVLEREDIDLIISDQKMPGMIGLDFLEKTINDFPGILRILLTGHAELNDAIQAINKGCIYKFILKPWNNEDLKLTVKRALEQRDLILKNKYLTMELQKRDLLLAELTKNYPGITVRPQDGIYVINTKNNPIGR